MLAISKYNSFKNFSKNIKNSYKAELCLQNDDNWI